jgi:hypothetical protein
LQRSGGWILVALYVTTLSLISLVAVATLRVRGDAAVATGQPAARTESDTESGTVAEPAP